LPGLPGSAAFMAAYHVALAGEQMSTLTIGASRHTLGSVAAVVAIYLGSSDFTNLSPATRRDRRRILERFRETYGEQDFAALTGAHVDKILATLSWWTVRNPSRTCCRPSRMTSPRRCPV
jgi:hypothetical protein